MWLSGYQSTLEGDAFPYASIAPEIRTALLVRGNKERPAVAWETAPIKLRPDVDVVGFVWVFAMAVSPTVVPFTLHANDAPLLTFHNPRVFDSAGWTFPGRDGASLTFRVTHQDRHGDPMGFALLRLPAEGLPDGEPVRLRLTSEDKGTPAWTMVYEHALTEAVAIDPFPLVRRADGPTVHWVRLDLTHLGEDAGVEVSHRGQSLLRSTLTFGRNKVPLPLPAVRVPTPVRLDVRIEGREPQALTFEQQALRPWVVHLVQHTHTDIGYTRQQREILPEHLRFLDTALDLCDATDDWPDDATFRWTCEASWPVREYLRSRPPAQIERLRRRVAEGRIELTALPFNLSEVADEASLLALLDSVKQLRHAGLPVRLAMQNDVNGLAWCLADSLPTLGVDAFVMGQHAHRALACFDHPTAFWWESPSGERLLGYRGEHYMLGNEWGVHGSDFATFEAALVAHLRGVEQDETAFDRLAIQYSGTLTDNAPPSLLGPTMIRLWNERYLWPKLRSATGSEFLDWIRETHGESLPVHRKAWPDWWTDGFGSAAQETAAARQTGGALIAVQGLAAMALARGLGTPPNWASRVQDAYDALLFWDEHTLGAAESISDPTCENTVLQWGQKAATVWDAAQKTCLLQETALGWLAPSLPLAMTPSIVVFNPLGWTRTGTVEVTIDPQVLAPESALALLLPSGERVAAEAVARRPGGSTWRLQVPDVPAMGHTILRVVPEEDLQAAPAEHGGTTLENDDYRIVLDPETGCAQTLVDKALGVDLVDPDAAWGMFAVVHEILGNRHQLEHRKLDAFERRPLQDVRLEAGVDGPIYQSLSVRGTLRGCTETEGVHLEIRLFHKIKQIQIACRIRKLAVTDPEAVYVAFPFGLADGEITYEAQGGVVSPGRNQLPGSSSDWHTVQGFVSVQNEDAQVVLSCDEIPLWHLGGLNLGRFRPVAEIESPHVYSWVMNNYWVTNFRASQEGEFAWHYDLVSGVPEPPSSATRFGSSERVPLVARVLPGSDAAASKGAASGEGTSSLRGDALKSTLLHAALPANVLCVTVRPTEDGRALFLHLREVDGLSTLLEIRDLFGRRNVRSVALVDAVGENAKPLDGPANLAPLGVCFLRVDLEM